MILEDLLLVLPEIFLATMACLILLIGVFFKSQEKLVSYVLSISTLFGTACCSAALYFVYQAHGLDDVFIVDNFAVIWKILLCIMAAVVLVYSRAYIKASEFFKTEYFALSLFVVLGVMVVASSNNFLTLYIGIELFSLPLYALMAMCRQHVKALEAAMKYFIMGAMASGVLLYGVSFIYGITGELQFTAISSVLSATDSNISISMLYFGLVFVLSSLVFKFGLVPFHMWVPDVYEGATTPIVLLISTVAKLAAFAAIYRVLTEVFPSVLLSWQMLMIIIALLSIAIGNIAAIIQTNFKRMLGYATIAHVGFIILGLITGTTDGSIAAMFYVVVYSIMSSAAFGMILFLSRKGIEAEHIADFRGLGTRHPWFAALMLLLIFSMAGIPPMVGFYAKFLVLQAVVASGFTWVAVVALHFAVIGAFYYLRIIRVMFFAEPITSMPDTNYPATVDTGMSWGCLTLLSINGFAVLLLGIFPGLVLTLCRYVT